MSSQPLPHPDPLHKTLKFVGFSGLIVLVGFAVAIGRWQSNVEQAVNREAITEQRLATADKALQDMNGRFNVGAYRVNTLEKEVNAQQVEIQKIREEVK